MDISAIIPHIEALIFASEKPLTSLEITELINNAFGFMDDKLTLDQIEAGVEGVIEKYRSEFYPFEVRESGGGWQFLTKKDYHKTIAQLNGDKFLKKLSGAALETLSIIAYKQPITKGEIEGIRGVNSDYSIQKLLEKELIVISGRNENMPGKPLIYNTSKSFMDYFGINNSEELPKIREVLAEQVLMPTLVNPDVTQETDEEMEVLEDTPAGAILVVREDGELIEAVNTGTDDEDPKTLSDKMTSGELLKETGSAKTGSSDDAVEDPADAAPEDEEESLDDVEPTEDQDAPGPDGADPEIGDDKTPGT